MSEQALSGLRVLDLSRLLPGPFCSMLLGDLGADVIKIEEPGIGDPIRYAPPILKENSAYFLAVNRNKRSLTLNLRKEEGRRAFFRLAKTADVVLDGFRPGVMGRLGLGYETLRETNGRLIMCAISGYGQDGPYAQRAGHDLNYISVAGVASLTGGRDGRPVPPGPQMADIAAGALTAAYSILAAVIAREKTGSGQFIDVSMMDGMMAFLCLYGAKYFADGINPAPAGEPLNGKFPCYNLYQTADGRHLALGALEPPFWASFCRALGREEWVPLQYATGRDGCETIEAVQAVISEKTREAWVEYFREVDCCLEPVNTLGEAFEHPQVRHRRIVEEMEHPVEGTIRQLNVAAKFSGTPAAMRLPPPAIGADTDSILRELGYVEAEIAAMRAGGVL